MTDLDLDRLGDLWRQRPTPAEMEAIRKSAEAVRTKARWGLIVDNGVAIVVAAVVLVLVFSNPTVDTMVVGGAAIALLLVGHTRTRRFRAEELRSLTGSTQDMLDQAIARARATVKRTKFQLIGIVPSFALGLGIAALVDRNAGDFYTRIFLESGVGIWVVAVAVLVTTLLAISFTRSMRSTRAELDRLVALRESFQAEGANAVGGAPTI